MHFRFRKHVFLIILLISFPSKLTSNFLPSYLNLFVHIKWKYPVVKLSNNYRIVQMSLVLWISLSTKLLYSHLFLLSLA